MVSAVFVNALPEIKGRSDLLEVNPVVGARVEAMGGEGGAIAGQRLKFDAVMPEISAPSQALDTDQLAQLLLQIREKCIDAQLKASETSLEADKKQRDAKNKELVAKLLENLEKIEQANAAGVFGKIFGWIATALALVAGGATANPALIAAALVSVAMMTVQETGAMKNLDSKAAMAISISMAVLAALLSFGAGAVATGASGAQAVAQGTAQTVQAGAKVTSGVVSVARGGATIANAVYTKDAADAQADVVELQGVLAKLKALMDDEADVIAELCEKMQSAVSTISQMAQSTAETNRKLSRYTA